ncbi:MAG: purine-nucleoside phosphorylase [Planctomycetota bacterium]|jgi:purine-nucleoside phosphorylase
MTGLYEQLQESVGYIRDKIPERPQIGVVLGTGWQGFTDELDSRARIEYPDIPNLLPQRSEGAKKGGSLIAGRLGGVHVACLNERFHLYEGFSAQEVAYPVRVLCMLGVNVLFVTNAAGGINTDFGTGDLMLITDQINMTLHDPLVGVDDVRIGAKFPDMTTAYDPGLINTATAAAGRLEIGVKKGVYVGVCGPTFETPAEIAMFRTLGADAVGMSTVIDVIAARQAGVRVCGLSCITNKAAGLGSQEITEAEVHAVMDQMKTKIKTVGLLRETIISL